MNEPKRTMLSIQAKPDTTNITTAEHMGQTHTVIPCVALVEGVLWPVNAPGPELALAEEFGRFPQGWDGRPVVYDHPKVNGEAVPANSPEVLEDNSFGQLFNTRLEDNKLKLDLWINHARIAELSEEGQEVANALKNGDETIEVSTGLFTMSESVEGKFDGEAYVSIWRNIVPDHLAILPRGVVGACSIEDGCGAPRENEMHPVMRAAQLRTDCGCDVVDNANTEEGQKGIFQRILDMAGGVLGFTDSKKHLSDTDLRKAIDAGLRQTLDDNSYYFIMAVYPDGDAGTFIYEAGFDGTLFQRSFSIEGSNISIGSNAIAVRPETKFVPVKVTDNSSSQENVMSREKLVNDLIANKASQFTENNREWLETLEEDALSLLSPIEITVEEPGKTQEEIDAEAAAVLAANSAADKPVTTDDYIAEAPEEIRQVLNSGLDMHRKRKAAVVSALVANDRCKFTQEQLDAKDLPELENLASLAVVEVDYTLAGTAITTNQDDESFVPAPLIFPKASNANAA